MNIQKATQILYNKLLIHEDAEENNVCFNKEVDIWVMLKQGHIQNYNIYSPGIITFMQCHSKMTQ